MKKIMLLIIFSILTSCANTSWEHRSGNNSDLNFHSGFCKSLANANGTWDHRSNNNSNLNFDKGYCRPFANSKAPTYLCKNPFYCEPDEWSEVIISISQKF